DNLFLVDTVQNIMKHICRISGVKYGDDPKKDISLRVITDHIRSTTFMIGDGVMPSNEGRGYVLRRLLRRAARHGRLLGISRTFLAEVAQTVIDENKNAYPELDEKRAMITKLIGVEEESFAKTIDQGLQLLSGYIDNSGNKVFSGADAFRLNDTYGFPIDLTKEILAERGMTVDEEEFQRLMREQRERARAARKNAGADAWEGESDLLENVPETGFLGYGQMETAAKVLAIIRGGERVPSATAGDEVALVLDRTAFYAESGGQVGDTGSIESADAMLEVRNTTKNHAKNYLHHAVVTAGQISVDEEVKASVDREKRLAVMRNHTTAHLLQAALRRVLGDHVEQAGQLVNEKHVRFDFTHFSALTKEELEKVEQLVNQVILSGTNVECREMPIEEAKKLGAMALFGEKYGDIVRVVTVGGFSREFCGGTHMDNTAKIGLFKILSESSVAAGVRRIEGVTGTGVLDLMNRTIGEIDEAAAALKLNNSSELVQKAAQLSAELKEKDRTIEALNSKLAGIQIDSLIAGAKQVGGVQVITAVFPGTEPDALRALCDKARDHAPNMVAVFAGTRDGKANIAACVAKEALAKGVNAGQIVRAVAQLAGGNGGGRADSAMAGAKDLSKLDGALAEVEKIVANMLK
ncbi:MAG: alanine--tRNA ligase, partial [Ruminococcaceae bacterium]|nr:alanine--tRNA ligase [Oscillospiraceae bacterium]